MKNKSLITDDPDGKFVSFSNYLVVKVDADDSNRYLVEVLVSSSSPCGSGDEVTLIGVNEAGGDFFPFTSH